MKRWKKKQKGKIHESNAKFESLCTSRGVHFKAHLDKGVPVNELVRESLFARFDRNRVQNIFFQHCRRSKFSERYSCRCHCPVIAVPDQSKRIESLLLTFDGKSHSIYAIKHLPSCLQDSRRLYPATLLSITQTKEETLEYEELLKEYLSIHYQKLDTRCCITAGGSHLKYCRKMTNPLIVMGHWQKRRVAFFSKSAASRLLKEQSLPIS
jgi:hypothetical protein